MTEEQGFAEKMLESLIPGYRGYRIAEERREQDRMIRDYMAGRIDGGLSYISKTVLELTRNRKLAGLSMIDRLRSRLEKCRDRLLYAERGYSGWFSNREVTPETLERIEGFDRAMVAEVSNLVKGLSELPLSCTDNKSLMRKIEELERAANELEDAIAQRTFLIKGL